VQQIEKVQPEDNNSNIKSNQQKPIEIKVTQSFNLETLQARYPQPSYPVCEEYKRNNCPHGRDGKTEVDGDICKKLHPKKCFAWCKAGKDERHGCNKGSDCTYYHPVLCRNSVRYRKCTNAECTFTHLRFTKRYNPREQPQSRSAQRSDSISNQRYTQNHHNRTTPDERAPPPWLQQDTAQPVKHQTTHNQTSNTENKELTFLVDLIQSMKKDMTTVNLEMQEFKRNIMNRVSHIQHQMWQPTHFIQNPQAGTNQVLQNPTAPSLQVQNHPQQLNHQIQVHQQM